MRPRIAVIATILAAASVLPNAFGQQTDQTVFTTLGNWPLCESGNPALIAIGSCKDFQPGHELYGVIVIPPAGDRETIAYQYSVTATLTSTQTSVTVHGVFERTPGNTVIPVEFGGPVYNAEITITRLIYAEPRVSLPSSFNR
jgi:hypothetical protein